MVATLTLLYPRRYGRGAPCPVTTHAATLADLDDAALVVAMARGDREALGSFYDRYAGLCLALGRRVLRDTSETEEVVHEVFVEAFRCAHAYDPARGSARAWLTTRMRSRALDRVKSAGRSRAVQIDELGEGIGAVGASDGREDDARLHGALAELPAEQRAVLELAYFEGLSSTEIASRLGVPVGTVKSRTAAAFAKLRVALGDR